MIRIVKQVDFADIFRFAEKMYGIGWNPANDVFFGNALDYGSISDFYVEDWGAYCNEDIPAGKASDLEKGFVLSRTSLEQSYIITAAFCEELGLTGDIQIDCR